MANFSGAVKLVDLNDFIAPSQACVVNIGSSSSGKLDLQEDLQADSVQLQPRTKRGFSQTQLTGPTDAVKVTLHDCLACSGCVTSAESVLLEHQSVDELLAKLAEPGVTVVVSVSPQSRASLAALYGLTPKQAAAKLTHFFKSLGAEYVFDTSCSRDLALLETAQEFIHRYRATHQGATDLASQPGEPQSAPPAHSNGHTQGTAWTPASSQQQPGHDPAHASRVHAALQSSLYGPAQPGSNPQQPAQNGSPGQHPAPDGTRRGPGHPGTGLMQDPAASQPDAWTSLPMLASACPGWVCYAEKTHGEYVLPYISTTKSPQAVMGSIVKQHMCPALGLAAERVYHCAVMPCFDKKLEASRDDFYVPGTKVPEVDSVLTSSEVQQLLEARGADLASMPEAPLDSMLSSVGSDGQLFGTSGGAGGYLEYIFRTAARELFGREVPAGPLPLRTLRNADFKEISLEVNGRPVLRFAAAYGFRNIQTLMRKIKRGVCEYDYIEIMACPAGCLNGGGQIKPVQGQGVPQLLEELEIIYHHADVQMRHPADNDTVRRLYEEWVQSSVGSEAARRLLHTQYHHRQKTVTAMIGDW